MNFDLPEMECYKAVWLAVLQQAIADLMSEAYDAEIPARTARRWFKSEVESVGSFKWVCDVVNLDRESVLQRVRDRLREHTRKITTAREILRRDGRSGTLGLPRRPA